MSYVLGLVSLLQLSISNAFAAPKSELHTFQGYSHLCRRPSTNTSCTHHRTGDSHKIGAENPAGRPSTSASCATSIGMSCHVTPRASVRRRRRRRNLFSLPKRSWAPGHAHNTRPGIFSCVTIATLPTTLQPGVSSTEKSRP